MKRLLVGLTAMTLIAGCGSSSTAGPSGGVTTEGNIELAAVNVAHLAGSAEDAASAGSAINAFGMALYRQTAADNSSANLVVSPTSIALALSMARAGARGQTAVVMRATSAGPGDPVTLIVDHPFLFALRDVETGAVLFLGRITDPSAR